MTKHVIQLRNTGVALFIRALLNYKIIAHWSMIQKICHNYSISSIMLLPYTNSIMSEHPLHVNVLFCCDDRSECQWGFRWISIAEGEKKNATLFMQIKVNFHIRLLRKNFFHLKVPNNCSLLAYKNRRILMIFQMKKFQSLASWLT